ncbi:sensor histidine kinase [Cylindrospermopsis raciborskii S07]|nr:hepN [Cylindrospermopsis raciborskii CS-505]PNJ96195.1 sensor histidine kinase [Cylindrospermopsis raciborskii C03]PNJ99686.1 sensor histidine kinase [Cylindrospermopsis raciborskii C04]PNK00544.1 sensor histidine kinase [Cylindrospermopsis raciborskii C07]PNK04799.1 sensor histidine kinase [Cylindrospermopsis raciborskii S07]PNK06904.1 sensor histidine kinase [Cylindrospermopsis raciborskii S10]PNK10988.1 sensor histidine kinase [Cylindrospermopsis raciborskii S14]PNK11518.1 sensor histi
MVKVIALIAKGEGWVLYLYFDYEKPMNFTNFLYLAIGMLLGIVIGKLLSNPANSSGYQTNPDKNTWERSQTQILQQLHQTELAYEMAREMSQFHAGFLSRISHELRSPINGLIGLHQLILHDLCENPQEEREFINQAYERSLQFLKIIDQMLNIARIEHGTNHLVIESVGIREVFQEVEELTYMLAANRNFPLQICLPPSEIYVLADKRWLRQILVSLIDNTISIMESGYICLFIKSPDGNITTDINNHLDIYLDLPSNTVISHERLETCLRITDNHDSEIRDMSPGMKLLINQRLLEMMGGKLEIIEPDSPPISNETTNFTRLQITLPQITSTSIPEVLLAQ